jgi:hypothetical protein
MKYKLTALTLILAVSLMTMSPGLAVAQSAGNPTSQRSLAIPVSGTASSAAGAATVAGTFQLQRFAAQDGKLVGIGTLVATVTDSAGARNIAVGGIAIPVEAATSPATGAQAISAQAVCDILHLTLGPLHLDLLGLVIDLNQVVLDITAESGAGNLLGNLLCAVTGLLDQTPSPVQQIVGLLNQILQILGG